jgi:hypothetical protein
MNDSKRKTALLLLQLAVLSKLELQDKDNIFTVEFACSAGEGARAEPEGRRGRPER